MNVLVLQNGVHFRGQNTGGTIQRGECFVKLGHMAADRRIFFHEINFFAGIGKFQSCLNSGDTAADNHHIGIDVNDTRGQRRQKPCAIDRTI